MFATPQRAAYAVDRHTVLRRDSINVECVVPQTNRLIAQTQHKSAGKLMDDHHVAVHVLVHYAFGAIVLDSEDRGYRRLLGIRMYVKRPSSHTADGAISSACGMTCIEYAALRTTDG